MINDQTTAPVSGGISTANMHINSGIYLALGDSITQGYTLADPNAQSYPALIAAERGFSVTNLGKSGFTPKRLLAAIENEEYILSDAELITVSIGSNDIFGPVMVIWGKVLELPTSIGVSIVNLDHAIRNWAARESPARVLMRLNAVKNIARDNQELYQACIEFTDVTLPRIAEEIRKRNDHAQLIFTNMYNPYAGAVAMFRAFDGTESTLDMSDIFQPYVEFANRAMRDTADYRIADIGTALNKPDYVNASFSMMNMRAMRVDPHPNAKGHVLIKQAVNEVYIPKN